MINWKKAGLTALAGSLVATSAYAGAVTVSGTANLTYTANSGQEDTQGADEADVGHDGSRWGLNKSLSFSGSGELDNGWTVSVSQTLKDGSSTGLGMTIDMGDMGSLNYEADTGARGIGKIKDMMPTADEDVGNGIDVDGTSTSGGLSGTVSGGTQGFHYSKTVSDMIEVGVGYAPKSQAGGANGAVSGTGAGASNVSGFVKIDPMDGLEVGFGVGEAKTGTAGDNSKTDDHMTAYATYVWGSITVGYQYSEIETVGSTADDEQTRWGVLYALNDEVSISYQNHTNEDTTATDEEASGWSASYTSGGITFKAHRNTADDVGNAVSNESEHTEVGVTFAF
tara:strand:- start:352 stop:1368 length:1017 start_codon:yes stop_codon:yes gene_type:complete